MKKLGIEIFCLILGLSFFTGCVTTTGQYLYDNKVAVYKVVTHGVVTLMTKEQIQEKKLDKIADTIEYIYSVEKNTGKIVE